MSAQHHHGDASLFSERRDLILEVRVERDPAIVVEADDVGVGAEDLGVHLVEALVA